MTYDITALTAGVISEIFGVETTPVFKRTRPEHGDYTTNAAMLLAGQLNKPSREIAETIVAALKSRADFGVEVAGPGFINITLGDDELFARAMQSTRLDQPFKDQVIVAEYSDPNPFKSLHAGHLYTSLVGDAIANIMQAAGARVHRVNFGGDVGLHVA